MQDRFPQDRPVAPPSSTLRWYRNRLAAMSARERAWRVLAPARAAGELTHRRLPRPHLSTGPWPDAVRELAAGLPAAAGEAARIAAGELSFWGRTVEVSPASPDWAHDPLAGSIDPKGLWELHRQQHLFPLAAAARTLGNDGWRGVALGHVSSWIADNPRHKRGPGWSSSYETAHRLVQWAWAIPLLAESADAAELAAIEHSYAQQARFVASRPSRYSSANNHRVAEIVGLLHAAAVAGDAAAWARLWAELETHADAQAYPDGGSREQAAGYFLYVLEMLWVAALLARSLGRELGALRPQLERRVEWAIAVGDGDLEPPPFGDDAEDRIIRLEYYRPRLARDIVTRAVALLDDELALAPSRLLEPARESEIKPSGIAVLRGGASPGARIALDVGELGFGALAAHGHADALSLIVDSGGERILRDSGTGSYAQAEGRELLRSTAAHNTVEVGGLSQAQSLGPHLWGRRYRATIEQTLLTDEYDYVRARHDGYVEELGAVHTRAVLFLKPNLLLVTDLVVADEPRDVALHWHLPCDAVPAGLGSGASLHVTSDPGAAVADEAWPCSPRYRSWSQASRWSWRVNAREVRFVSLIAFVPGNHHVKLRRRGAGDEIAIGIDDDVSYRVTERWDGVPDVAS
jgi:uncharacterized heparinase superfamily protein